MTQVNPACSAYVLQSQQWHSYGICFLIFDIKVFSILEYLLSFVKMSHFFELKMEIFCILLSLNVYLKVILVNCNYNLVL